MDLISTALDFWDNKATNKDKHEILQNSLYDRFNGRSFKDAMIKSILKYIKRQNNEKRT